MYCYYQYFQSSDSKSDSPVSCRICLFLCSQAMDCVFLMFEIVYPIWYTNMNWDLSYLRCSLLCSQLLVGKEEKK